MPWTPTGDNQWCDEVSNYRGAAIRCPKCGQVIIKSQGQDKRDGEGELLSTEFNHPCGAKLTLFND